MAMQHAWRNPHLCIPICGLLLLIMLHQETLALPIGGEDSHNPLVDKRRPAFLFDAWGKRGGAVSVNGRTAPWRVVGKLDNHLVVAIPLDDLGDIRGRWAEALQPLGDKEPAAAADEKYKRGAYLNLPWGKKK